MSDDVLLKAALEGFEHFGTFGEPEYATLRRVVADVGRVEPLLLDGFVGLFFERHVLDDVRRRELIALMPAELVRAVRHRFKQVVAGQQDGHQAWHALSAHVRDALSTLRGPSPAGFPSSLSGPNGFSAVAVEQAVAALWAELGRRPTSREATSDLLTRYGQGAEDFETNISREFPAALAARLDAQRLARGILELLTSEERALLRAQLDGRAVDAWAQDEGISRATAYRLLTRLKALCRGIIEERTKGTQLAVLDALREQL